MLQYKPRPVSARKLCIATLIAFTSAGSGLVGTAAEELAVAERDRVFALTHPGKAIITTKTFDANTGTVSLRSDSDLITSYADLQALIDAERAALRERYGRINGALRARFDTLDATESVDVTVHLARPPVQHPNRFEVDLADLQRHATLAAGRAPATGVEAVRGKYSLTNLRHVSTDNFTTTVTRDQLDAMKFDQDIAAIEAFVESHTTALPAVASLATSALNPGPHPSGATGAGVRASTFEHGIWNSVFACMGGLDPANVDIDDTATSHDQFTFINVRHAAPDATLYHRDDGSPTGNSCWADYDDTADIQWLTGNEVETSSLSCTRFGNQDAFEFLMMDDMAYTYPYTNFFNPTANSGYDHRVNWETYNALSVGNVKHFEERHFAMHDCTQARNPNPVSGGCVDGGSPPFCASDREMPHVLAPGITPSSINDPMAEPCIPGHGVWCGTSFSAPTANGIGASVISADPRMKYWPERVRLALILTAHNVDLGHWNTASDGRDGTGTISGADAIAFARNHVTVYPDSQPPGGVESGMATFHWSAGDPLTPIDLNMRVPDPMPRHGHLRAVLLWDSNPDFSTNTNALSDLDLMASTEPGVYDFGSFSEDSNVEVIDIPAVHLSPGATIPLRVFPSNINIPPTATAQFFYWAAGWTWVGDHAQFDPNLDECTDNQDLSAVLDVVTGSVPLDRSFSLNGDDLVDVADARYTVTLFDHDRGGTCTP